MTRIREEEEEVVFWILKWYWSVYLMMTFLLMDSGLILWPKRF